MSLQAHCACQGGLLIRFSAPNIKNWISENFLKTRFLKFSRILHVNSKSYEPIIKWVYRHILHAMMGYWLDFQPRITKTEFLIIFFKRVFWNFLVSCMLTQKVIDRSSSECIYAYSACHGGLLIRFLALNIKNWNSEKKSFFKFSCISPVNPSPTTWGLWGPGGYTVYDKLFWCCRRWNGPWFHDFS